MGDFKQRAREITRDPMSPSELDEIIMRAEMLPLDEQLHLITRVAENARQTYRALAAPSKEVDAYQRASPTRTDAPEQEETTGKVNNGPD